MGASWPPRPRHTTVGGLRYAYVDEGTGPPVVLVHGNPSWSYLWRSLLTALPAVGRRAIAPDHIGMGRSAKPSARDYPHTLERRVADLTAFLAEVVPTGPVSLVVHDWGGAIALAWAVAHPERVDRLVLLNTAAFPLPGGKRLPLVLRAVRTPLGAVAVRRANAFAVGAAWLGVRRRLPADVRRQFLAPYDRPAHREAVLEFVRDIPDGPGGSTYDMLARTERELARLRSRPTLICWGMRDFVLDADILAHWEHLLPAAEVHRIADAGHYVLEDAGDHVGALITDFLRVPDEPPGPAAGGADGVADPTTRRPGGPAAPPAPAREEPA